MMYGLILAMMIVALLQPTVERSQVAIAFAGITTAHTVLLDDVTGGWYYFGAGAADFLTVYLLSRFRPSEFVVRLMRFSLISLTLNAIGWVIYMLYLPPTGYNLVFCGLYAIAILVMMGATEDDVGRNSMDRRSVGLRRPNRSGDLSLR